MPSRTKKGSASPAKKAVKKKAAPKKNIAAKKSKPVKKAVTPSKKSTAKKAIAKKKTPVKKSTGTKKKAVAKKSTSISKKIATKKAIPLKKKATAGKGTVTGKAKRKTGTIRNNADMNVAESNLPPVEEKSMEVSPVMNVIPEPEQKNLRRRAAKNFDKHHIPESSVKKGGPRPSGKKPLW
ncbi:MAG: hypothetical protein ACSLE0_06990 [Chitinophagaceae bacterium]